MEPTSASLPAEQVVPVRDAARPPLCPVCGALLHMLRGFWRCVRCQYCLCEGCEGGHGEA